MNLEPVAQTLVEKTSEIIGYPIIITDEKGKIIGSTDHSRLGIYHKVSVDILKKNQAVSFEQKDVKQLKNVLPGVATPILFNNKPIGVLGIVGDPQKISKYAQLVKSHVEMMCYETFKQEMVFFESKTLDTFVQYLLHNTNNETSDHIMRYGEMLGYDMMKDRVCLIINMDSLSSIQSEGNFGKFSLQHLQQELFEKVKYLFVDHSQDIISLLNLEDIIILKVINANYNQFIKTLEHKLKKINQFLNEKYNLEVSISLGNVVNGADGIKESYENAIKAQWAGRKTQITPKIYRYNDWQITLELLTNQMTPYIINNLLNSTKDFINHDNYPVLSSTFMNYCKCNMNLSESSRSMFIHRNTLVYRLERIGKLTSLNPYNFEHCLLLYTAIKSYEERAGKDQAGKQHSNIKIKHS
jgi:carbohydrate diacid regulator